jgi:predicted HAD superfamily phosphohydrolase
VFVHRTLSFGADSPGGSGSPAIPTSATYVKIPTAPEAGPCLDDGDESADGSEYEDAVSSDESDASPELGDEVPLLARRLSQEEITDALLAEAASTAMRLDPASSPALSARGDRRRSTAAVTSYAEPFVNRKMRRD